MQVNAINYSYNNLNFQGKHKKKQNTIPEISQNHKFMGKLAAPTAAVIFMLPVMVTPSACTKIEAYANAEANASAVVQIPKEDNIPIEIEDSLNIWRHDIVDVPVDGDDGETHNRILMNIKAERDWEGRRPEEITLNLKQSNKTEARYDHEIADSIKNDIRVTLVKPGDITVVRKDGTITDQVGGLMFNEDGVKTFAHSNGKDKIFIYPKATSGQYQGKFVELGTMSEGYLYGTDEQGEKIILPEYGINALLTDIISPGTEDHYVNITGKVVKVEDIVKSEAQDSDIDEQ